MPVPYFVNVSVSNPMSKLMLINLTLSVVNISQFNFSASDIEKSNFITTTGITQIWLKSWIWRRHAHLTNAPKSRWTELVCKFPIMSRVCWPSQNQLLDWVSNWECARQPAAEQHTDVCSSSIRTCTFTFTTYVMPTGNPWRGTPGFPWVTALNWSLRSTVRLNAWNWTRHLSLFIFTTAHWYSLTGQRVLCHVDDNAEAFGALHTSTLGTKLSTSACSSSLLQVQGIIYWYVIIIVHMRLEHFHSELN